MNIRWTPTALADLQAVHAYVAADKVGLYAARIVPGKPGSIDLDGSVPDLLGVLTTVALLLALGLVVVAYWRASESTELLVLVLEYTL